MNEVAENKWKELREEVHGKEKVNWLHVAKAISYTWNKAVWLGSTTESSLFYATIRGRKTATAHQIRDIVSLVESSFELDDPGEIEETIEYAAIAFGDGWDAKVDKEFVAELAASAVEADKKKNGSG